MSELKNNRRKYANVYFLGKSVSSILQGILLVCIIGLTVNVSNWQFWLNLIITIFLAIINLYNKQ